MPIPERESKPTNWTYTEPEPESEPEWERSNSTVQGGWFEPTTKSEPGN